MNKFVVLLISLFVCFGEIKTDNITYKYSDKNILSKDFSWMEEKVVEEEIAGTKVTEEINVLDAFNGRMSGYGPDCVGCSGFLAYNGLDVRSGNIYYEDREYGRVRIAAADRSIPFGSIIEVDDKFLIIILDRGGGIGFNKGFQFDLLYESEMVANMNGVFEGKFEVLRYGF